MTQTVTYGTVGDITVTKEQAQAVVEVLKRHKDTAHLVANPPYPDPTPEQARKMVASAYRWYYQMGAPNGMTASNGDTSLEACRELFAAVDIESPNLAVA